MKVLIAPDKFRGSLSAHQVSDAIEAGILNFLPQTQVIKLPLADGGDGSLQVLEAPLELQKKFVKVKDPLFREIEIYYGLKENTAFIEMASASGVQLLKKHERNPMLTSTYGTGQLIRDAVENAAKEILLFLGGSATNDCGMGVASALGYLFRDVRGKLLQPIGKNLSKVAMIDTQGVIDLSKVKITALTDVWNPLYGENGAAHIFAAQKGASESEINELDQGLKNFSKVIKNDLGIDVSNIPGGGAAGGLGAGAIAFCNAKINGGINIILDWLDIDSKIAESDLVITGEGLFDRQTLEGKVVKGVMDRCEKLKKPLGIICGNCTLKETELEKIYYTIIKKIQSGNVTKKEAMGDAYKYLVERSGELIKEFASKPI